MFRVEQTPVGPEKPLAPVVNKIYVGKRKDLRYKTALVGLTADQGFVVAQFDDITTSYGYGWWRFSENDFIYELNL